MGPPALGAAMGAAGAKSCPCARCRRCVQEYRPDEANDEDAWQAPGAASAAAPADSSYPGGECSFPRGGVSAMGPSHESGPCATSQRSPSSSLALARVRSAVGGEFLELWVVYGMEARLNTDARNPKRKVAGSGANMETIFVMGGGARLRQDGRVARLRPRGDQRADRGNGRLAVGEHASHRHRGGRSANRRREVPHPLVARGRWRGAWLHVRVDGSCCWQVGLCFLVLRTVPCPRLWQLCQNQRALRCH